jgi:probable rRNA maturation factor
MEIDVADRQSAVELDHDEVLRVLRLGLKMEGRDADLSVVITGDAEMRDLNLRFGGRDCETDVLAFGYGEDAESVEGEIIVNAELAARQAESRAHSAQGELMLYLVHGLLHLTGCDDHEEEETRQMREREQRLLEAAGYSVVY